MTDTNRAEPMKGLADDHFDAAILRAVSSTPQHVEGQPLTLLAIYRAIAREAAAEVEASRLPLAGAARYRFWIDTADYTQPELTITGRQIKELASVDQSYGVWMVLPGPIDPPVGDDEAIDLRGNEARFFTGKKTTIQSAPALAGAATSDLDVAGVPKLPLSVLESLAVDACNRVKAWAESDRKAPFPEDAHMLADGVLMLAAQRRKGVQ